METVETQLRVDDFEATAIAIEVRGLPESIAPSAVFPCLYEHGIAVIVDRQGYIRRVVNNIRLDNDEPVLVDVDMPIFTQHASVGELRQVFETTSHRMIPLVDEQNRYTGLCASHNEMMKLWTGNMQLPRIGGLATPLGVYLTTGIHTSGAGTWGLVLTGLSFAIFVTMARQGFFYLLGRYHPLAQLSELFQICIVFGMLLVIIRLSPLAGLHAAEHQTIHVIEKGLPLTPTNVLAQPRDHRRCGTNIMVGLVGLEMGVWAASTIETVEYAVVFSIFWTILIILGWQQIGRLIQRIFTTSRPARWQVNNAVEAGKALINKFKMRPHGNPKIWQRVWGSGMIQILASFTFFTWIFQQLLDILDHAAK